MQEDIFEKFCADKVSKLKEALQDAAKDVIQDISNEYLPYVAEDTVCNVEHRVNQIIKKLLCGQFTVEDGKWLRVEEPHCFVSIGVSTHVWDDFRKELIKLMPECPKDKEIESLQMQLKQANERRYY